MGLDPGDLPEWPKMWVQDVCLDNTSDCAGEERKGTEERGTEYVVSDFTLLNLLTHQDMTTSLPFCCLNKNPPGNQGLSSMHIREETQSDRSWFPEVCNRDGIIRQELK